MHANKPTNSAPLDDNTKEDSSVYSAKVNFINKLNDIRFLKAKSVIGNFECKRKLDHCGILSFGFYKASAEEWGKKHFKDWMRRNKSVIPEIEYYTGNGSKEIRDFMDGVSLNAKGVSKIVEKIHTALLDAKLPEDVSLYKVMSINSLNKLITESGYDGKIKKGILLRDKSFMSTSLILNNTYSVENAKTKDVFVRIAAQKGQHAAYINEWSSVKSENRDEYEVLVDKDGYLYIRDLYFVPKSEVLGEGKSEDVYLVVEAELIQE